jgi:3-(methylthio)propionyl---CoA ligase
MKGNMMQSQLTLTGIMKHAKTVFPQQEIVSVTADNPRHRYSFAQAFDRASQLASALKKLGVKQGDRIGTLAWNDYRHFELYYGSSCSGLVCHTINPRLFPEQIAYIINHAEDRLLFVDPMFVPLIEALASQLKVEAYVVLTSKANMPQSKLNLLCYEELLAGQSSEFNWPELDENDACALCYTSGTTGNPKGVLYSHRAMTLHAYASLLPDVFALSYSDVIMPIVPMFHVNAWSIPYGAAAVGAKIVFPGPKMADGATLSQLINTEGVTCSAGVPTVWLALLNYLRENKIEIPSLNRVVSGGSACPWAIMDELEQKHGVYTLHAWGMTEMSPLGTFNARVPASMDKEKAKKIRMKQGRPTFGVELRIVDANMKELPRDGIAFGALQVRGPWVCERYFKQEQSALTADGWFDTGDVATIDPDGYMSITDRTKDVIKSGGEWISSIELENHAVSIEGVAEAAVIGVYHPKWDERPLLIIVKNGQKELDAKIILKSFEGKVASWWIPNDCVFVEQIPHTATGKISKKDLRVQFEKHQWSELNN